MKTISPFQNDAEAFSLGAFTVENGTDRIALYGSLTLTRDKAGLEQARALKRIVDRIVSALEHGPDLPERVAAPEEPTRVKNPFA